MEIKATLTRLKDAVTRGAITGEKPARGLVVESPHRTSLKVTLTDGRVLYLSLVWSNSQEASRNTRPNILQSLELQDVNGKVTCALSRGQDFGYSFTSQTKGGISIESFEKLFNDTQRTIVSMFENNKNNPELQKAFYFFDKAGFAVNTVVDKSLIYQHSP